MARRAKRVIGGILFSIALVAFLAFVFLLFVEAENIDSVPGAGDMGRLALVMGVVLGAIGLVLLLLLLSRRKDRPADESEGEVYFISGAEEQGPEPQPAPKTWSAEPHPPPGDVVVHDLADVPVVLRSWSLVSAGSEIYSYPCNVQNGVYTNDYIAIDDDRSLKLRTLLAGPEPLGPYILHDPVADDDASEERAAWEPEAATEDAWAPEADEAPAPRPQRPSTRRQGSDDIMSELERRFGAGQR